MADPSYDKRSKVEGGGRGSCLCGAVRYVVDGPLRNVVACHCTQCRKQSGHHYAASDALDADLTIEGGENLTWYAASDEAKRGFCSICGSALFWKDTSKVRTSIMAGSLDEHPGLTMEAHIFCADKGSYYEVPDDAPSYPQGD